MRKVESDQKYLILYALLVIPVTASIFFMRRGSKQPVRLRMKADAATSAAGRPAPHAASAHASQASGALALPQTAEKSLNVLFNWNGHSWDAFEVLGVPAGSSGEAVQAAYQKAVAGCDVESAKFFRAALEAIQNS